ncbi:hypothetical protein IFM89_003223 [Coptis chinensis]|uniref:3'-5' exonuclease domain-containing protein n=1 Tax=Coptis chinensis TaxID=261450 RepID=A0A835H3X1_9MAGN|nr:hypothetical protein IFM89_003223 [Coptis chinensis]
MMLMLLAIPWQQQKNIESRPSERVQFVEFNGITIRTTVTYKGNNAAEWIRYVKKHCCHRRDTVYVGLDTEDYFTNKDRKVRCATLQLCIGTTCIIYQLQKTNHIPQPLVEFLKHTRNTFVGVDIASDAQLLEDGYGLEVTNQLDLRFLAVLKLNLPKMLKMNKTLKSFTRALGAKRQREFQLLSMKFKTADEAIRNKVEEISARYDKASSSFPVLSCLLHHYRTALGLTM